MTVAVKPRSIDYLEDGVTLAFAVPWKFNAPEDVKALRTAADGTQTTLAYGSDYSVTGGETDDGGELTVTAAAVAGTELSIWNETDRAQTADYATDDTFPAETHEARLDNLAMVTQEQDAELARRPSVPRGSDVVDFADLADLEDGDIIEFRGGQFQRKDPSGFAGKFYAGDAEGRMIPASGTGNDAALRTDLAVNGANASMGARLAGYKGWFIDSQPGDVAAAIRALGVPLEEFIGYSWSHDNEYHSEIQKALTQLDGYTPGAGTAPIGTKGPRLLLPSGAPKFTSPLTLGRQVLQGVGSNFSGLYYAGAPGVTAITAPWANVGIHDVMLQCDANNSRPATMLDITSANNSSHVIDYQTELRGVYFGACSDSALKLASLTNGRLMHCRWDNAKRMVEIVSDGTASGNRHLVMFDCTIDASRVGAAAVQIEEWFKLDLSGADNYHIAWDYGRQEDHATSDLADPFSILRLTGNSQPVRGATLSLRGGGFVTVGALGGSQTPAYINFDSTQTNLAASLKLDGFLNLIFGQAFRGNVGAYVHNPVLSTTQPLDVTVDANLTANSRLHQYPRDAHFGEYTIQPIMSGNTCIGFSFMHPTAAGFCTLTVSPQGLVSANPGTMAYVNSATLGQQTFRKGTGTGNTGWLNVTMGATSTTAALGAIANAINTTAAEKWLGRQVLDTTTKKLMIAQGSNAGDTWVSADGGTTVTPV